MKKNFLFEVMSRIDDKYIEEAIYHGRFRKKSLNARKLLLIAACVTLMAAAVIAVPLMMRGDDRPSVEPYDFSSPEFEDFELDGTTLIAYNGGETESLVIPEGIESIADYAFLENENASKIKVISLSSTVKSLGNNALAGCGELKELVVSDNGAFVKRNELLMTADGETVIQYIGDTERTSFLVPEGVKYISAHAFQSCNFKHVVFPEGLLYIGYNAFAGVPLEEINLPESLIELADGAFSSCIYALDGSFSENLKFTETSFNIVPFYLTKLAGQPCPSEDIARKSVSISEAFGKSNSENITKQFADVLEYYRTGTIPEGTFCYGGIYEGQPQPEGAEIPDIDSLDFASLKLAERDWDSQTNVDVIIPCEGGYDMLIGYRIYDRWECLYWKDVRWRVEAISFIPTDAAGSADLAVGEWFIEYETDGAKYNALTFTNASGVSVYEFRFPSEMKYTLKLSPDGSSFIVEYMSGGKYSFFVEDLSGKLYETWWSYEAPCVPYFSKLDGAYIGGSAEWNTDPETMEEFPVRAKNENGEFLMNYSTGVILRDDAYIYYDIKYTGGLWGEEQKIYDGSDKYSSFIGNICWVGEADINGELIKDEYVTSVPYGVIYKPPHTWNMGMYDMERGDYTLRIALIGRVIKVPENFVMTLEHNFSGIADVVNPATFRRVEGDGVYIKEWVVSEKTDIIDNYARKAYFVEIRTTGDYIIPFRFYSYNDTDSADYFDRVIVPVIESVRLCESVKIEEIKAEKRSDGQYMTVGFTDGGKSFSGTLSLDGIADISSYTDEDSISHDISSTGGFIGVYNYFVCKFDGEYYFHCESYQNMDYTSLFCFKLSDNTFIPID